MKKLIKDLSIKNKLVFVILSVTFIAVGTGFTIAIYSNIKTFRDDTVYNTVINAKFIGYYSVPALAFYDRNGAEEILGKLQVVPYIKSAHIYDEDGNLFARFTKIKNSVSFHPGKKSSSMFKDDDLFVSEPIMFRGQNYGTIILNTSTEILNRKINAHLVNMILIMIGVMILAYFCADRLQSHISEPVQNLSQIMEQISSQADYSLRVTRTGEDEIGLLYDGFNNMLSQIQLRESERNEAAKALQAEEERYRILFNSGYDAVFVYQITADECTGKFIEVNNIACNRLEYSKEEILNLSPFQVDNNHCIDFQKKIISRLVKERHVMYEQDHVTRSGKIIPVEVSAHLFYFNNLPTVLSIARDITERKHTEQELKKHRERLEELVEERTLKLKLINEQLAQEITERKRAEQALKNHSQLLEAANKELESFSYSVSHDLRAPLRAIDGFSVVLLAELNEKLDMEGRRILNIIIANTKKMGHLIDDLLAFSRLGRKEMGCSDIDVNKLVEEINQEIIPSGEKRIKIITGDLGEIYGDRSMIRQVFYNLIANAVKFSSGRELIIIEIGKIEVNDENVYFIKDNGVGFDMKYSNKLFGVFQRLHGADEFEGTGVGLALVKRVINRHGGKIWAESEPDKGATFLFSIPEKSIYSLTQSI